MFDGQLISELNKELTLAMEGAANRFQISAWEVTQKMQPTQQGTSSEPSIFFQKLFDVPNGWPQQKLIPYTNSDGLSVSREVSTQPTETHFQITSLKLQNPNDLNVVTAADMLDYVKLHFQAYANIQRFAKTGIRVLRIDKIDNPYFENDNHQFEAHPAFTLVVTYNKSFEVDGIPSVTGITAEEYPV